MRTLRLWVVCVLLMPLILLMPLGGHAENNIRFGLNNFLYSKKDEISQSGTSSTSDKRHLYHDILAGYVFSNRVYLGLLYASDSVETAVSSTTTVKELLNHYGLSLGYVSPTWYFLFHYVWDGSHVPTDSEKWSKAGGYQGDIGYAFNISSSFSLGLQLAYRKLEYKKFERSGAEISNSSYIRTEILPMVGVIFQF